MTSVRDLVFRVEEADVTEAIGRLYDRRETPWLPEAVADVLTELRRLTPDPSGAEYQLDIELVSPRDQLHSNRRCGLHGVLLHSITDEPSQPV